MQATSRAHASTPGAAGFRHRPRKASPRCTLSMRMATRGKSRQHRPGSLASIFQSSPTADGNPKLAQNRRLGIVIVDHGSRKAQANETLQAFGELFSRSSKQDIVEVAHMELAEPTIEAAVQACVRRGATHVVVAPYFLSRGRHVQNDIPRIVDEVQALVPDTPIRIAEPIDDCTLLEIGMGLITGIDGLMAQLINNRVNAASQMFN